MSADLAERLYQRVNAALSAGDHAPVEVWLGLGLENVPGKPFGWAFNQERRAIKKHLAKRSSRWDGDRRPNEFTVTRIQERLHRHHPTYRDRAEAWKRRTATALSAPGLGFSPEQLAHLVELFTGANDPLSASLAQTAAALLGDDLATPPIDGETEPEG